MFCSYCGTSRLQFFKTGKLGCSNCYSTIIKKEEIQRYINTSKETFLKLYEANFSSHFKKSFQFIIDSGFPIRIRFARNVKNFPFRVSEFLMDDFFMITQKIFSSYFSFQTHSWKYSNELFSLELFDEDHYRISCFPRSLKEIFEFFKIMRNLDVKNYFAFHENYKYLTACPTNSYLSNKLSIQLELSKTINAKILQPEWISIDKGTIDSQKKQRINFFIKNFHFIDLKRFFQFWEHFIKSKTSNYK